MNWLHVLTQPVWRSLVLSLLHTLWQGGVMALLVYIILRGTSARRHNARYVAALAAQCGVLLAGLTTWAVLNAPDTRPTPDLAAVAATPRPAHPADSSDAVPAPTAAPAAAAPDTAAEPPGWVALAAVAWLLGVALMLIRTMMAVAGARRLAHGRFAPPDALWEEVVGLCGALGIGRRVRIVLTDRCIGPAVLGVIWPTLMLPVSLVTALPPASCRAILAHELAHIRRHDYLLNLAQMLVESLLFFNPAVWWLGRQARAEREACCDALAVAITGEPLGYAEALAGWLEHQPPHAAAAAPAWTGTGGRKPILDRVRRVLLPDDRPDVPISWSGLAGLLIVGPLLLAGLWQGTTAAVAVAGEILSPAESTETTPAQVPLGTFTISGRVRMADGSPLPPETEATGNVMRPNMSSAFSLRLDNAGRFTQQFKVGTLYLHVQAPGQAIAFAGPFRPQPDEHIKDVELVVSRGFSAQFRFVDPQGTPLPDVLLEDMTYRLPSDRGWLGYPHPEEDRQLRSDAQGMVTLEHCSDRPLHVDVRGGGFQFERREWNLTPDAVATWTLRPARPTTGVVVSEPDGRPVAGARLFLAERQGYAGSGGQDPRQLKTKPLLAVSDAQGRFRIDTLRDDCRYLLYVEAEGHGVKFVRDVAAGQHGLRVALGPPLSVRGRLTGDLSTLLQNHYETRTPYIKYRNDIRMLSDGIYSGLFYAPVTVRDGVGTFEITDLFPGHVELILPDRTMRLDLHEAIDDLEIDLPAPPEDADLEDLGQ